LTPTCLVINVATSCDAFAGVTGTWRFNAARSSLSTPAPQSWVQEIVAGRAGLSVREIITRADGAETDLRVQAALDGSDCPVEASAAIGTMAYTRPAPDTILGNR